MSDRGAYVLSVAVLIAAVLLAFGPRREAAPVSANPAAVPPGSPVVQVVEFKDGQRAVVAVMPDGRYAVWSSLAPAS